ncbi:22192_t:CDS:2 [Gigaspora margarita]|uniref:22192_t:CDS:1 n=1 Tax=Gigaspora margarita TaxID=4874 RepID=A0ABN7V8Q3_GIGMA|nr:22192_t:CDS:2 [Gigaspora margarita]
MDIDRKTKQSKVREYKKIDQVSETKNEKKHGSLVKTCLFRKWETDGLASAKSLEAIISSLMSDIKTKLYEEIQKANRVQECPNRS